MSDPALAALASSWWIALLFFGWGVAEATAAPIVPDVGLGFLALATPAALGLPLAAAIAGGVVGALVLVVLGRQRPVTLDRLLQLQPGLGGAGMEEAGRRIGAFRVADEHHELRVVGGRNRRGQRNPGEQGGTDGTAGERAGNVHAA